MSNSKCDLTNPDFSYAYCPSYAAAVLFAVLFGITTAIHVGQAFIHRKPFAAILIMGGIWEVVGYMMRSISIQNPYTTGLYTAQLLLILLAPLWINAFIYMLVGRMIHFFLDDDRIFKIKARKLTLIFVFFDISAFLVQAIGGSMTSSTDLPTVQTGLHVYTGGMVLQILFNAFFLGIVVRFQLTALPILRSQVHAQKHIDAVYLLRVVYAAMAIILFRNFYRLAEFASGVDSPIIKQEWYAYVFDAVPMFVCLVVLNVFHPGLRLKGPRCDFSEENKALKLAKQEKKAAKKAARQAKKTGRAKNEELALKNLSVSSSEMSFAGQV